MTAKQKVARRKLSLLLVHAVWIGATLLLYPACRSYADLKRRSRDPIFSYL